MQHISIVEIPTSLLVHRTKHTHSLSKVTTITYRFHALQVPSLRGQNQGRHPRSARVLQVAPLVHGPVGIPPLQLGQRLLRAEDGGMSAREHPVPWPHPVNQPAGPASMRAQGPNAHAARGDHSSWQSTQSSPRQIAPRPCRSSRLEGRSVRAGFFPRGPGFGAESLRRELVRSNTTLSSLAAPRRISTCKTARRTARRRFAGESQRHDRVRA